MAAKTNEVYMCSAAAETQCTCMAEMIRDCATDCVMTCCGKPMTKAVLKTQDQGKEKHVPVIEKIPGGYKVKVGGIPHPMEADHFIQFIELRTPDGVYRKHLKPGMAPEATFKVDDAVVTAIEFCNKHGVWTT